MALDLSRYVGTKTGRWPSGSRVTSVGIKSIIGHSHSPQIAKGTYTVGTSMPLELNYNQLEQRIMMEEAFPKMCGDCIGVKLQRGHDPLVNPRRVCQFCRTVWPGYETGNRRHEAVMATKAKRSSPGGN